MVSRKHAIEYARASILLKGFVADPETDALIASHVQGRITTQELVRAVKAVTAMLSEQLSATERRHRIEANLTKMRIYELALEPVSQSRTQAIRPWLMFVDGLALRAWVKRSRMGK